MELIQIKESDIQRLIDTPEEGMGYQFGTRKMRFSGTSANTVAAVNPLPIK